MKIHWKTVLLKLIVWIAAEIVLNCLGSDSLADYSEFLHDQEVIGLNHDQPAIIAQARKPLQTQWGVVVSLATI